MIWLHVLTIFLHFRYLCLDEADRMIDMGFEEDVRTIFSYFKGGLISEEIFSLIPPSRKCEKSLSFLQCYEIALLKVSRSRNKIVKTHSGYYPECVSFVFWEKLRLDNFVSILTDLYPSQLFYLKWKS